MTMATRSIPTTVSDDISRVTACLAKTTLSALEPGWRITIWPCTSSIAGTRVGRMGQDADLRLPHHGDPDLAQVDRGAEGLQAEERSEVFSGVSLTRRSHSRRSSL